MKAVQVVLDEELLRKLASDPEVKRHGRSAVLRRAATEYLKRNRKRRIAEAYRQAYAAGAGLGDEFTGWEREGSWPAK
jgi:metal-responsive CopG/Arc/MetJ family transcriptional regulator